jgi:hypothetical protein
VKIITGSDGTARNVSIGDHADQPIVLADWDTSDTVVSHDAGHLGDWDFRRDPLHVATHDFLYDHGVLPIDEQRASEPGASGSAAESSVQVSRLLR